MIGTSFGVGAGWSEQSGFYANVNGMSYSKYGMDFNPGISISNGLVFSKRYNPAYYACANCDGKGGSYAYWDKKTGHWVAENLAEASVIGRKTKPENTIYKDVSAAVSAITFLPQTVLDIIVIGAAYYLGDMYFQSTHNGISLTEYYFGGKQ